MGLKYPTSDGNQGQVIVTNGSGVLTFEDGVTSILPGLSSNAGVTATTLRSSGDGTDLYLDGGIGGSPGTVVVGGTTGATIQNDIKLTGQDISSTPSNTSTPAAWMEITVNTATYYIPLHQ